MVNKKLVRTHLRSLAAVALLFVLGACAQIPAVEFNSYREAFQAARDAGETVLAQQLASAERLERSASPNADARSEEQTSGLPRSLSSQAAEAGSSVRENLELRLAAFDTINRYNDALVSLAEGKTPEQVGASFNGLVGSVTNLASIAGVAVPGLGAAAPIIQTFLEFAERARTRAEFKRALTEGSPIILQIMQLLHDDIKAYEHTERALALGELDTLGDSTDEFAKSAARLAKNHKEPTDPRIIKRKREVAEALAAMMAAFDPDVPGWVSLSGDSEAGDDYSELVQSQLDQFLTAVQENEVQRLKIVARIEKHQALLSSYRELLGGVSKGLARVQAKLDAPPDLTAMATELSTLATTVRAQIDALRDS